MTCNWWRTLLHGSDAGLLQKQACFVQILNINVGVYNACIAGDLHTAEELLAKEINTDVNNYHGITLLE
jgi:hypothetical protein